MGAATVLVKASYLTCYPHLAGHGVGSRLQAVVAVEGGAHSDSRQPPFGRPPHHSGARIGRLCQGEDNCMNRWGPCAPRLKSIKQPAATLLLHRATEGHRMVCEGYSLYVCARYA
jgi:hypothetical protein